MNVDEKAIRDLNVFDDCKYHLDTTPRCIDLSSRSRGLVLRNTPIQVNPAPCECNAVLSRTSLIGSARLRASFEHPVGGGKQNG